MNNKQLKKLKRQFTVPSTLQESSTYITKLKFYLTIFNDIGPIKYLINQILLADNMLSNGRTPQPLPPLLLPDNIQDTIVYYINNNYALGDPTGDALWDKMTNNLPALDALLRDYRDYLAAHYGVWAYINSAFINDLAQFLNNQPVLEIMAGNGLISASLMQKKPHQLVYTTDDTTWKSENNTGRHPFTPIEPLDALSAIKKYGHHVKYIIMAWSPDGIPIDVAVLNLIRQSYPHLQLIVIGEKNGATNSSEFWQIAKLKEPFVLNQNYKTFDLIDERVYLVK
ncbi:hypothetical protein JOC59_001160 [Weissella beninensis]|uniref:SAM-dependent methyltransferase n=1 Tax=Periweissella beninensis TaxID=504936 RepID=A0ABT0VJQ7_9LACO|nr:SAM-dependent methyltransferase [Periweissella beninensis]MBM7544443.1 hypothetical protein [Periweissella beninensis]MCM2437870.1 SAM-dependent methyltransferase [Periweissella beninensis]